MPEEIRIITEVFSANDAIARQNQELLNQRGVYAVDLIASPGAGKTSLIEQTLKQLSPRFRISVVNGDLATQLDKERAEAAGAKAVNINTGGECHLDANMVRGALSSLDLSSFDLILIENVGNLICPASFKLGAHHLVVIASVPEGDDKPYKYPGTFAQADAVLLNKIDLLPYVPFNKERFIKGVKLLNPRADIIEISCLTGFGISKWCEWLVWRMAEIKSSNNRE